MPHDQPDVIHAHATTHPCHQTGGVYGPPTHPAKDPVHSVEIAAPSENHLASVSGNQTSLSDFPLDATVDLDASETLAHTNTRIRT